MAGDAQDSWYEQLGYALWELQDKGKAQSQLGCIGLLAVVLLLATLNGAHVFSPAGTGASHFWLSDLAWPLSTLLLLMLNWRISMSLVQAFLRQRGQPGRTLAGLASFRELLAASGVEPKLAVVADHSSLSPILEQFCGGIGPDLASFQQQINRPVWLVNTARLLLTGAVVICMEVTLNFLTVTYSGHRGSSPMVNFTVLVLTFGILLLARELYSPEKLFETVYLRRLIAQLGADYVAPVNIAAETRSSADPRKVYQQRLADAGAAFGLHVVVPGVALMLVAIMTADAVQASVVGALCAIGVAQVLGYIDRAYWRRSLRRELRAGLPATAGGAPLLAQVLERDSAPTMWKLQSVARQLARMAAPGFYAAALRLRLALWLGYFGVLGLGYAYGVAVFWYYLPPWWGAISAAGIGALLLALILRHNRRGTGFEVLLERAWQRYFN